MANKLLSMNKTRQILIFLERGASLRSIENELKTNRKTIRRYRDKFQQTGHSFTELLQLKDHKLEEILGLRKPKVIEDPDPRKAYFSSQLSYFNEELAREGVSRQLLWGEYIKDNPSGFKYSMFCELLRERNKVRSAVMRFEHRPAEMMQVDFAGAPLYYVDTSTGELIACPVFIAALPFSSYGYVEALPNAKLPQVVKALNNTLEYLGGVPLGAKSDNMKQWVIKSCRYEPTFTDMLGQWASHNNIALYASRPYKPKDKPAVENAVKIAYLRIYATLRNQTFYSLAELNKAIKEKLELHHKMNFQKKTISREELFMEQEKPQLQALPQSGYTIKHYTKSKVQKNYHVIVGEDWHFYSVPCRYIGREVRITYCCDSVEIYHDNQRIALHTRNYRSHHYSTIKEHMPESHQAFSGQRGWSPEYYLQKATDNGPNTYDFMMKIMESKQVIEQSYSSCQGILRLIKAYGPIRTEAACKRGLKGSRFRYTVIKNILENNMDQLEEQPSGEYRIPVHVNLRGPETYHNN